MTDQTLEDRVAELEKIVADMASTLTTAHGVAQAAELNIGDCQTRITFLEGKIAELVAAELAEQDRVSKLGAA